MIPAGVPNLKSTLKASLAFFIPLEAGRYHHRLGRDSETSLAEPRREPQLISHHTGKVLPGAELSGVCRDPGKGAEGVLRELPTA